MYEVDEESPGTTIIDGTTDDAEETPRKRVIRKVDDDEEDEDELEKAAARKADDEDSEVKRTKVTTPGKIIERDGSQVSLPDRRKIISRKLSTARRLARGPVVVSNTAAARKRNRPTKRM